MNDLLRWADGRLLVLVFGDAGPGALERLRSLAGTAPLRCVHVLGPDDTPGAREYVRDPKGHLQGACHVFGHAWALVRPDSYVAATGESVDAVLVHAVGQALGARLEHEEEAA
jgi:3-(3-hydroxy-phenyl)propionate hydroxylase